MSLALNKQKNFVISAWFNRKPEKILNIGVIRWESLALDTILAAELKKKLPASKTSWEYSKLLINLNGERVCIFFLLCTYKPYLTFQMLTLHPTRMFSIP